MEQTIVQALLAPEFLRGVLILGALLAGSLAIRRVLFLAAGYHVPAGRS